MEPDGSPGSWRQNWVEFLDPAVSKNCSVLCVREHTPPHTLELCPWPRRLSHIWKIHVFSYLFSSAIVKISLYVWETRFHLLYNISPVSFGKARTKTNLVWKDNFKHCLKAWDLSSIIMIIDFLWLSVTF